MMRPEPCNSWCVPDARGNCRYCGWPKDRSNMTVTFYDVKIDEHRDATQVDLDCYAATAKAYGKLRRAVETIQAELIAEVKTIRSKAGEPMA